MSAHINSSPITYYGGKKKMLKHILPLIPPHDLYVEPFCGGAAVFFAKPLAKASVINDTNGLLVNFYQQMKLNFNELYRLIDATPYARDMHKKAVHICRNPTEFSDVEKAWALYINLWQSKFKELNKGFQIESSNTIHSLVFCKKRNYLKHATNWIVVVLKTWIP